MARTLLRGTAAVGVLGLGLLAMSPAVAATGYQAGATALSLGVGGQDPQGTGLVTAKYENGAETKTGETEPAFPQPAQDNFKAGVLVQEATAGINDQGGGFSAACAGLGGSGKGAITIGDSSCLSPGSLLNGSLANLSVASLIKQSVSSVQDQLPAEAGPLKDLLGQVTDGTAPVVTAVDGVLEQFKQQVGNGGLNLSLEMVEGRCTASDNGPTGDSTLANAKLVLNTGVPGQAPIVLINLPANPPPNTRLDRNLSVVLNTILDAVDAQLTEGLTGGAAPLTQLTAQVRQQIVTQIRDQVEAKLAPLGDNLLRITLNQQEFPTSDSIKVRALRAEVITTKQVTDQLGAALIDLQIGTAACAPVAQQTAVVSPPQASTPQAANPATPTGVSSGVAGPATEGGIDPVTWALLSLGALAMASAGLVGARRVVG